MGRKDIIFQLDLDFFATATPATMIITIIAATIPHSIGEGIPSDDFVFSFELSVLDVPPLAELPPLLVPLELASLSTSMICSEKWGIYIAILTVSLLL